MPTIKIKKLKETATVPTRYHYNDAGIDVYACERTVLPPHTTVKVPTGIAYEIPDDYCLFGWDKGSVGSKGIKTLGGVLDAGYRGEVFIPLHNLNDIEHIFEIGDKIAQLVLQKIELWQVEEVTELSETERGDKAFGSSGK